jgi:hypothetical protein
MRIPNRATSEAATPVSVLSEVVMVVVDRPPVLPSGSSIGLVSSLICVMFDIAGLILIMRHLKSIEVKN